VADYPERPHAHFRSCTLTNKNATRTGGPGLTHNKFGFPIFATVSSSLIGVPASLGPRQVPHTWAFVGDSTGRVLISFTPAGKMEAFFNSYYPPGSKPGPYSNVFSNPARARSIGIGTRWPTNKTRLTGG
jgi:hypothetical protein